RITTLYISLIVARYQCWRTGRSIYGATSDRMRSGRAPGDLAGGVQHLDARLAGLVDAQADAVAALRIGEQDLGVLVVVLDRDAALHDLARGDHVQLRGRPRVDLQGRERVAVRTDARHQPERVVVGIVEGQRRDLAGVHVGDRKAPDLIALLVVEDDARRAHRARVLLAI